MKIFISQLMKDRTDEEILKERNDAIEFLKEKYKDAEIIFDSFVKDYSGDNPLKYLAKSIEFLAEADLAVFLPNWSYGRGCRIEHDCCIEYGIEVSYYGE